MRWCSLTDDTTGAGLLICAQGQDPDEEEGDDASILRLRAAKGDPSRFEAVNVSPVIRYYAVIIFIWFM